MKTWIWFVMMIAGMMTSEKALAYTLPVGSSYAVVNGFFDCRRSCYHLGDDVIAPAGAEVRSICTGTVVEVAYRGNEGNYGGRVLVQCMTEVRWSFSMDISVANKRPGDQRYLRAVGQQLAEGQVRAGSRAKENGNFVPHLHLGVSRGGRGSESECGRWVYGLYRRNLRCARSLV